MRPGAFTYKGLSSLTYKIISQTKRSLLPPMRSRLVEIYGKHGSIDFGQNNYSTRQMTMHIAYIGNDFLELRSRAREIAAWLTSKQWEHLSFDDEPDKYYLARIYDQVGLETLFRTGQADITFECQPFAYLFINTGADPTWDEADFPWLTDIPLDMPASYRFTATADTSFAFNHPGTQDVGIESPQGSKMDLVINGTWDSLTLSMGGKTLNFTAAQATSGTLIIDSVEMEATLNGVNRLDALTGDLANFLTIQPGQNTLQIDGTNINVAVTVDFIPMWL